MHEVCVNCIIVNWLAASSCRPTYSAVSIPCLALVLLASLFTV